MQKRAILTVRPGLTLLELVVVMAILGVLAAMLLPRFEGFMSAANEAAAASSTVDAAKLIGQYKTVKTVYPDRWDSLTDGTSLWTAGSVPLQTKGLHNELTGTAGDGSDAKLVVGTLTAAQQTALNKAGIYTLLNVDTTNTGTPGNMFTQSSTVGTSSKVALVNAASTGGKAIIDHIYRANLTSSGTSGTLPTGTVLMVFGLGPQSSLIPNSMLEAPTYGNAEAAYIYNRLLAVFEVNTSGTTPKATFRGVLGADGDTLDTMSTRLQSSSTSL